MAMPDASKDIVERAEIIAVVKEINSSDEPFAGQF